MKQTYVAKFQVEMLDPSTLSDEQVGTVLGLLKANQADFVRRWNVLRDASDPRLQTVWMTFNVKVAVGDDEWMEAAAEAREAREPMDLLALADGWLGAGGSEGAESVIDEALREAGGEDFIITFDEVVTAA